MTLSELLPLLHDLKKVDKIRVMQFLVEDLAQEEGLSPFRPEATYPIWSPYDSFEAASTLSKMLAEAKKDSIPAILTK